MVFYHESHGTFNISPLMPPCRLSCRYLCYNVLDDLSINVWLVKCIETGEPMYLLHLFESMPLPFLTVLLPFLGGSLCGVLLLYNRFVSCRTGRPFAMPRRLCRLSFLTILILNVVFSYLIWSGAGGSAFPLYTLTSSGWSSVLLGDAAGGGAQAVLKVDAFGALSAALMSFIAMIAGIRALSDEENGFTPRRAAFYLFTCAGVQGIFYANSFVFLFIFMIVTQVGVSGLYRDFHQELRHRAEPFFYYLSRVLLLVMFLSGAAALCFGYGTDSITTLASRISPSALSSWAFILLIVPLLYIFIKPSPSLPDAARNCFFGIRTQASLFVAFRIVFSVYGPMQTLHKVPFIFIILGLAFAALGLCSSCGVKDPERFFDATIMYIKGMVLVSIGVAMNGVMSAERAALYGVSALEAMILLWLIFLPVFAALSILLGFLRQRSGHLELWQEGGLIRRIPLTSAVLFIIVCVAAGLPPFVGYSGKQLLFRSASFIDPLLLTLLFAMTAMMLFIGLRFLATLLTARGPMRPDSAFRGESSVALPLILLLILFFSATAMPGLLFEGSVATSVECLINRTAPSSLSGTEASK